MARRPRSGGSNRRSRSKRNSNRRPKKQEGPIVMSKREKPIPTELTERIVLLDQEDFYGIYLDLMMFNMTKPEVVKVSNRKLFDQLKKYLEEGKYKKNIYIIDETFGWGIVDIKNLVEFIREKDSESYIIGLTAMLKEDMLNPEIYDAVNVKSRKLREDNILFTLTSKLDVEFVESNTDEKYKGPDYMQELLENGDDYPQKIYRDHADRQEGTLL